MIRFLHAVLAVVLLAGPAHAGPDRLSILLGSHHVGARMAFEPANPGLILTWEDRGRLGLDLSLGAYRNSYGRGSVVASVALPVLRWDDGALAVFAGAALYPRDGRTFRVRVGDVVLIGGLQLRHRNLFLQILPGDGRFADAVFAAGLTFSLR